MRKFHISLLLCLMLPWTATQALPFEGRRTDIGTGEDTAPLDDIPPGILCDRCRDFDEYPMDVVAVIYNAFFGDDPWLFDSNISFPIRVYALDRSWVLVWFEGIFFDVPTLLPDLMDVVVRMPDGQVLRFTLMQGGPDLPFGDPYVPPQPGSAGNCGCGGGGGGDDDDYEEPEDLEDIEFDDDRDGVVDIIDPDEEGDFPEWEEEV